MLDACQWHKPGEAAVMRRAAVHDFRRRAAAADHRCQHHLDRSRGHHRSGGEPSATTTFLHSLFALRAARDITPWGSGTLVNSNGEEGEKATFGQSAAWCAISANGREIRA